jgi:uncharacterized repeat protein (TIGR03843 family)
MNDNGQESVELDIARLLDLLAQGEMAIEASMPYSSNYTLLTSVEQANMRVLAVYKPRRGERPLWDFPRGTLYRREAAAYVVSEALGFGLVPPTVVRDGPYGIGAVQLFVPNDEESHLFTMLKEGGYEEVIRQLVAYDFLINNADRKSGHCLKGLDGRMWAIDHGICFHYEYKLRTVLWDFVGQSIPDFVTEGLDRFQTLLDEGGALSRALDDLLDKTEVRALRRRLKMLLESGTFPAPGPGPNVPWPPV